ncbi:hypothetical protein Tco_0052357 [Tanacetum coccineum]
MALQMINHTFRPSPPLPSIGSLPEKQSTTVTTGSVFRSVKLGLRNVKVRSSSLEGFSSAGTEVVNKAVIGVVTEVDKDTFWPIVEDAADKTVVLDMYTQHLISTIRIEGESLSLGWRLRAYLIKRPGLDPNPAKRSLCDCKRLKAEHRLGLVLVEGLVGDTQGARGQGFSVD